MDVAFVSRFLALLALVALGGAAGLVVARLRGATLPLATATTLAWGVAIVATAGSLYYSEVVGFEPCRLCWYQRIAMYPLVVVLGVAALRRDAGVRAYALPLAGVGLTLSSYHYLLQHVPSLDSGVCSATAPCTAAYVWELGFVSIPFMAGAGFLAIVILLLTASKEAP